MSNALTNTRVFHTRADVYDQWAFYAETQLGITIILLNEYYASTIYHRATIIATPAQTVSALRYHQQLTAHKAAAAKTKATA